MDVYYNHYMHKGPVWPENSNHNYCTCNNKIGGINSYVTMYWYKNGVYTLHEQSI